MPNLGQDELIVPDKFAIYFLQKQLKSPPQVKFNKSWPLFYRKMLVIVANLDCFTIFLFNASLLTGTC